MPKTEKGIRRFVGNGDPRAIATPQGWITSALFEQGDLTSQYKQGTHLFRFDGEYRQIHHCPYHLMDSPKGNHFGQRVPMRFICWQPEYSHDPNGYYQQNGDIGSLDNAWEVPSHTTSHQVLTIVKFELNTGVISRNSSLHVSYKHLRETTGLKEENQILIYVSHTEYKVVEVGDEPILMANISHDGRTIFVGAINFIYILDNPLI